MRVRVDCRSVSRAVDAARHRHERLGVTPHAVLADVQTLHLLPCRDAQTDCLLDDPEKPVAENEDGDEGGPHRDGLRTELVKAARVEKSALADAVELRQRGSCEETAAERDPDAGHAVCRQCAHRVIELPVYGAYSDHDDHPRNQADDDPGPRLDVA